MNNQIAIMIMKIIIIILNIYIYIRSQRGWSHNLYICIYCRVNCMVNMIIIWTIFLGKPQFSHVSVSKNTGTQSNGEPFTLSKIAICGVYRIHHAINFQKEHLSDCWSIYMYTNNLIVLYLTYKMTVCHWTVYRTMISRVASHWIMNFAGQITILNGASPFSNYHLRLWG